MVRACTSWGQRDAGWQELVPLAGVETKVGAGMPAGPLDLDTGCLVQELAGSEVRTLYSCLNRLPYADELMRPDSRVLGVYLAFSTIIPCN